MLVLAISWAPTAALSPPQPVSAMTAISARPSGAPAFGQRLLGTWYEIAASRPLNNCASGTMLTFSKKNQNTDTSMLEIECISKDQTLKSHRIDVGVQSALPQKTLKPDTRNAANFKGIDRSWSDLVLGESEIVHLSRDDNVLLLWHTAGKQARLLSRRPFLTDQEQAPLIASLAQRGMPRTSLHFTSHAVCSANPSAASPANRPVSGKATASR